MVRIPAAFGEQPAPLEHDTKMASGSGRNWYTNPGLDPGAARGSRWYRTEQYEWEEELIRNLTRRDGFAERAVDSLVLGTLRGRGIIVDFGDDYVNRMWEHWHWNSLRKVDDIIALQRLLARATVRDGEIFLVARSSVSRPVLFLDWVNNSMVPRNNGVWNGLRQGGIEFNADYEPAAYHFQPPAYAEYYNPFDKIPPAPASQVAHVYRQDFDGQVRGMSWLGPALDAIDMLSDYTNDVSQALHILVNMPQYIQLSEDFGQIELSDLSAEALLELALKASVDRRVAMPPGAELKSLDTPQLLQGSQINDVVKVHQARVSRGTGVSSHTLTGSQGEANLSSIRAGEAENQLVYQRLQHVLTGGVKQVVDIWRTYYGMFDPRVRAAGEPTYTLSGPGYIDYRDRGETVKEVEAGLRTHSSVFRDRGEDPSAVWAEKLADADRMAEVQRRMGGGVDAASTGDDNQPE